MSIILFLCLLPFTAVAVGVAIVFLLDAKRPKSLKAIEESDDLKIAFAITILAFGALVDYAFVSLIT